MQKYCPDYYWLYSYPGVHASEFGMIRSKYFFLSLSLLSACFVPWLLFAFWMFGECGGCVACFTGLLRLCVHKECLLVLEPRIQQQMEKEYKEGDDMWNLQEIWATEK